MSVLIKSEVKKCQDEVKKIDNLSISEDRAFSHMLLGYIFGVDYIDQGDLITDGSNDGGIDFLHTLSYAL